MSVTSPSQSSPHSSSKQARHPIPQWDSGKPRLAMGLSAGIHAFALMGFLIYHVFPTKKSPAIPIFEMVSLEPPKLRPLRPKTLTPPAPKPPETREPDAPKLTSKPEKTVPIVKRETKVVKPDQDSTKPVAETLDQNQVTTTLVANIPADPRLSFWASRVKKKVETLWNPPSGLEISGTVKSIVAFQVSREGEVTGVNVSTSSGNAMLDNLAQQTLMRLERVPPIPENFPEDILQVSYEFVYSGQ